MPRLADRTAVRPGVRRGVGGAGTAADCAGGAAAAAVRRVAGVGSRGGGRSRHSARNPRTGPRRASSRWPRSSIAIARRRSSRSISRAYLKRRLTPATGPHGAADVHRATASCSDASARSTASTRASSSPSGVSSRTSAGSPACGRRFQRWSRWPTTRAGRPSFRSELLQRARHPQPRRRRHLRVEGIVGRCARPAAVHALELPGVRAGFRWRWTAATSGRRARRLRLDGELHAAPRMDEGRDLGP